MEALTPMEEALVDHVSRGERLDLTAGEAVDEASMRVWGKARTCHATVLRDILLGRLVACPEPHGLRLQGARISGQLDLQNLVTNINFELSDCFLEAGILAQDAQLAGVRLHGCQIEHPTEPPLNATRFTCSMLSLIGTRITGHAASGAVNLVDAHIGGKLDFTGASLSNDSGPALIASSLQSSGDMFLLRSRFTGAGHLGAVYLNNAHIGGELNCTEASLRNDSGPALSAESLQVDHGIFFRQFTATAAGHPSAVVLAGAHIGGQLVCEGATLSNNSGPALIADGLQVDHGMVFNGGFTATGSGGKGAVSLIGAHICGQLACQDASLRNDSGPALSADNLQADHGMILCALTATGAGQDAAVSLISAHIGGQLACQGASLRNGSGPVLSAESLKVDQEIFLSGEVTGVSHGPAVSLIGAQIGGQLVCEGMSLRNDSGPALAADGLQVGREMLLRGKFTAVGSGGDGTVRLLGARIGGQLDFTGASLSNDSGPALTADSLQADQAVLLTDGFTAVGSGGDGTVRLVDARIGGQLDFTGASLTATGGGDGVVVDLTDARIAGALRFDPTLMEHAVDPHLRLKVDGLTYAGVPDLGPTWNWLKLLRDATPNYQAQPYQQLAAAYRAVGAERQVREILMAQRDDQLARTDPGWPERLWGRIAKLTLGYGYQPWRALLFLTGVVALSCALAVVLGSHGALAQTRSTAPPGRPCTTIQQISVGLDLNLPVGTTLGRANCDLTMDPGSAAAAWLTAESWVLRILAWVFAALFIAGFTSAVRKT